MRPPRTHALSLLTAIVIGASAPAAAVAGDDTTPVTPPVVVVGGDSRSRFESNADTTGFVEIIDTSAAWRGYQSVGELLRSAAGVQIRRSGGREDFATVSVRGSTAAQVAVLLDGVALSLASNNNVNLADIPIDAVERIEVYRGFTPLGLASGGSSSTINIITKRAREDSLALSLSYGSFGSFKTSAAASMAVDKGSVAAFVTYKTSDGDFDFDFDDTPANPDDPKQSRKRRNNDHESIDVLLRYRRPLADGSELTLTGDVYHKDEGAPGSELRESTVSRFRSTRTIASAAYQGSGGLRAAADFTLLDETLRDPSTSGDIETNLGLPFEVAENLTLAATLRLGHAWSWRRWHLLDVAMDSAYEHFEGRFPAIANGPSRNQQRYRLGLALGDEIYIPRARLTLSPQLRGDLIRNDFSVENLPVPIKQEDVPDKTLISLDPRLGLRWQAWQQVTLQANAASYFRAPSFDELFGSDGFSAANPGLDPEQGLSVDAGMRFELKPNTVLEDGTFEYAYFINRIDDQIVFLPSGARVPRPQNIGKTSVRGHELRLELRSTRQLSLSANYTAQRAKNRSKILDFRDKKVPTLPDEEAFARLSFTKPRWQLDYELWYRGRVFLDQSNDRALAAYTTHSLSLTLQLTRIEGFALKLAAANLSDQRSQDRLGFPLPGRAFFVTLSYSRAADDGVRP